MSILHLLASSLGRRDEVPNQELAKYVVDKKDKKAVQELVENLFNKNKDISGDCIKVVYEIGELNPSLIAPYPKEFIELLDSKNNRMQWGAMTALSTITLENPKVIYASLTKIVSAADNGSVITRDRAVLILIKLATLKQYADNAFALLVEQLLGCPNNQLAMYAERAIPAVNEKNKKNFVKTLTSRLNEIDKDSQRKRIEKVIKKFAGK